jgi:PAS domain S-box-containing protein
MNCRLKKECKMDVLNILSLEDSIRDFEIIREQLINAGYNLNISRVDKEIEFVSSIRSNQYNIILADFKLPGFDAFGALRLCNRICPDVPLICVSGSIGEETAIELIKEGAVDYVLKDRLARLPAAVKRALDEAKEKEKRKLAEEALIVSEIRYRRLFESAKDGILILDAENGTIIDVNPFLIDMLGYSHEQFIKKAIWEIGFFKDIIDNKEKFWELQQKEYVRYEHLPLETASGRKIDVEFVSNVYPVNHHKVIQCNIRNITERVLAEKKLQDSEMQYRSLTENSPDLIARFDRQYRHLYVNQAAAKAGLHIPEDYIDKTIAESGIPEPEARKWESRIKAVFETGQLIDVEDTFETPNGFKYFNTKFVPEIGHDGSIISVQTIARDITQRKQSETELRKLSRAIEQSPVSIVITDTSGNIEYVNPKFEQMTGYSMQEVSGKNPRFLKSGETLPEVYTNMWAVISKGGKWQGEFHNKKKNGELYWEFASISAIVDGSRKITHYLGVKEDISEHKKTEEELKMHRDHLEELVKERTNDLDKERNLLRTLIDSLPDEIYAKDTDGRFIIANNHVLHSYNQININTILGKSDIELLPQDEAMKYNRAEHAVLTAKGKMINYEESVPGPDGRLRWHSITKVPMRDKEGKITGLVGINRDITYFKESEEILEKAKEAAEAANLAKSTFLSNMSHEIRTPLNAILGFSELMQADEKVTKKHIEWLRTINRSGEHLLALINDILEVSRIEAGRVTLNQSNFNLHSLLHDIEAMFRLKTNEKNLTLLFEYSDKLPGFVAADEGKLRQIIINLVGNAVKFTKEGGIALRAYPKLENDKIRFVAEVEDTGPGIVEKDLDKLFQKFGQTETGIKEGGTGLGLAISQQYAKIMNGNIAVRSKEGKGTCFTLTIDIENGEEIVKEENQKRHVIGLEPDQKLYRILVADDHTDNRELLKIMLTSVGFEVIEARNGNETIEKFTESLPDLILMDMRMPVMDGYETIRSIRKIEKKQTPIIAVTASVFLEDLEKIKEAGSDGYLRKPFKENELFECIESCLGVQYIYKYK